MKRILPSLFALLLAFALLGVLMPSKVLAATPLHDTNAYLPGAANTVAGAVSNGWTDTDSAWSINSHTLQANGLNGGFTNHFLLRPAGEARRDSHIITDSVGPQNSGYWLVLRWIDANDFYAAQVSETGSGVTVTVYKVSGGTPTSLGAATTAIASYADTIRVDLKAVGASPTVFTCSFFDVTTASTPTTLTVTNDSQSGLQVAGQQGVLVQSQSIAMSRVQTFDEASSPSLSTGAITASASTTTSINPQLSGITGGTSPYSTVFSYSTSTNGTYTQIGTAVAGAAPVASASATGLTPSTTYYFRTVTTDSAGTPATTVTPSASTGTPLATLTAATAYTQSLSASGGAVGAAVTITYTGNGTTTATITPAVSGVAGVFSPATIALNNAIGVTVTFTPSAAGTATFSSANSGTLTNPASQTYTVSTGPVTIAANDSRIYYSPGTWYASSVVAVPVTSGAYLKLAFTGTSFKGNLDIVNGTAPVYLKASVDGGTYTISNAGLSGSTWAFATGLASGSHTLNVFVSRVGGGDKWTSTSTNAIRFLSYTIDSGATLLTFADATLSAFQQSLIAIRPNIDYFYGDSRLEGPTTLAAGGQPEASAAFARRVATTDNAEYGQIGYSGTGYTATYNSVPPFYTPGTPAQSTWNLLDSIHARSFAGVTRVYILNGANDVVSAVGTSAAVRNSVAGLLPALRAALPGGAKIFLSSDMGGYGRADLTAAYNTYETATPDTACYLIGNGRSDVGVNFKGTGSSGTANAYSIDGLHGTEETHGLWAAIISQEAQQVSGGSTLLVPGGGQIKRGR